MDEKILKQKEAMEQFEKQRFSKETIEEENKQSIFDGTIQINQIPVSFSERLLLDGSIGIWMPGDFEPLSQEAINAIYLLGNKPDMVFGNTYLNFSVGFHYTDHEVPEEYMGEFGKLAKVLLERMGPKTHIYGQKVRKVGEHTISTLELVSHTVTDSVYNIMFFSSLNRRVLIGFINFNYKYFNRYHSIAEEMLQSFRFTKEE
jgi:hypothetical protein